MLRACILVFADLNIFYFYNFQMLYENQTHVLEHQVWEHLCIFGLLAVLQELMAIRKIVSIANSSEYP